jgi:cytochrome P450
MEMRLTVAELVRHFRFTTPEHLITDMTPVWRFVTRPKGNKYMVMVERVD